MFEKVNPCHPDRNDLDVEDDDGVSVQRDGLTYKYSEVCNESSGD